MMERANIFVLVLISSALCWGTSAQPSQGVLREVYTGIPGLLVSDLINAPNFPDNPDFEEVLPEFEAPTDVGDFYGQRLRALLVPPSTGNYVFWIASDDGSALYLSTDETPSGKRLVASVPGWASSRQWNKYAEQQSDPIPLQAGRQYYIEALMKEHDGGDNLAVRWRLPSGAIEEPIPGSRLLVYGLGPPQITKQPSNANAVEGQSVTFEVEVERKVGLSYQWQRNGEEIPGAADFFYHIAAVTAADHGSRFRCRLSNSQGTIFSAEATLSVVSDTTPPEVLSAMALGDPQTLTVVFSKAVDPLTATNPANYSVNEGVSVVQAAFAGDDRTVVLRTSPMEFQKQYSLTVNNVRDRAATPNTIAPGTSLEFSFAFEPLDLSYIRGRREIPGPSTRRTGLVISEIMYDPLRREDNLNGQFIELFNTNEWPEDLGGWRLSSAASFRFPPGTTIGGRSFLVVAPAPADVQSIYGITGVLGGFDELPRNGGAIRLRNSRDAIFLEAEYSNEQPYPAAAAGAGHSLVLARPSYGEGTAYAWEASAQVGGSPGAQEPAFTSPYAAVFINEFLAHTDEPQVDFIELYNYGNAPLDLSGCTLSDRPHLNKYVLPPQTIIPPLGFLVFDESRLGFALSSRGEAIFFKDPQGRVIDAVLFGGQENGVSTGRYPDGAPGFRRLAAPTPGGPNRELLVPQVVINELMYHPVSGEDADQYLELYNQGNQAVDLSGWRLEDGIRFDFPEGTIIPADGYLVVAKEAERLIANYPQLDVRNTVGNFRGNLSKRGERVALAMPDTITRTNANNEVTIETFHIVVDEALYRDGGRWGEFADGGGSSLELTDPRSDKLQPSNWADSDETGKAGWTTIEHTGVLDLGRGTANQFQIFLLGSGECLVDNVEVIRSGGGNLLSNPTFEGGLSGWFPQGNHDESRLANTGFDSSHSLHLIATGRGDNGGNRIRAPLSSSLSSGQTVTIRARVRWLKGSPHILLRVKGNYLEAAGTLEVPANLGTPGLPNSRRVENAGPAIHNIGHFPVLPAANQPVRVTAQVHDPDGLANLVLRYRLDPSTNLASTLMSYNGAGFYSATIPGQSSGTMVAFHIEATDGDGQSNRFPHDAPAREALVNFGEQTNPGTFGTYRIWMTRATEQRWRTRLKQDNTLLDVTFVYNADRVVYNTGSHYSGSPFLRPGYSGPLGGLCGYVLNMPKDDRMFGITDFVLDWPIRDGTRQLEQIAYWVGDQLGLSFNHRRFIHLRVNGNRRGDMSMIYEDTQQPNSDFLKQWFPRNPDNDLYKIEDWFEFDNNAAREFNQDATLQNFTTTGGEKKKARYRWNWRKRATDTPHDYDSLFQLVDAVNTQGEAYTTAAEAVADIEQWMRSFAMRRIAGDWDSYGWDRGKNMYMYRADDGFKMLPWDIDFVFGAGSRSADASLFGANDSTINRMYNHPPFRRAYLRAFYDAAHGPLLAERVHPIMDARHAALRNNGINASAPTGGKGYIAQRRNYILQQLSTVSAGFAITSNNGNNFSSANNLVTLTGAAPVQVKTLTVNGVEYPVTWTTVTGWSMRVPLGAGSNLLRLEGFDSAGALVEGATRTITVNYTGTPANPEDHLVINEIMYLPAVEEAEFVEIHNSSATHAFDLTNYRLAGVDFNFAPGTMIAPNGFLVLAKNRAAFAHAYGSHIPVAGEFPGRLQPEGERLRLVQRGQNGAPDLIVAEVTYSSIPPWPRAAAGGGASLQLIDPRQENGRVGNWAAVSGGAIPAGTHSFLVITNQWRYNESGSNLGTAWRSRFYNDSSWPTGRALLYVENSPLPAPKNTPLTLGRTTYYFRATFDNSFPSTSGMLLSMRTIIDDGAVFYLNGAEVFRLGMPAGAISYTTFASRTVDDAIWEGPFELPVDALRSGENVMAVEVHQVNAISSDIVFGMTLEAEFPGEKAFTPGAPNSVLAQLPDFPPLSINEIQPNNISGITDNAGERDPWLELFNAGSVPLNLADYFLTDDFQALEKWAFPADASIAPGGYALVWLDGQPQQTTENEWHANFRAPSSNGSIGLARKTPQHTVLVDYLNYSLVGQDHSFGLFPDGTPEERHFHTPTPGASNSLAAPVVEVRINEWMAVNRQTITNPADGEFDDWFELYNPGSETVDLSGYLLSDQLDRPDRFIIPPGVSIAPKGFLLVWADGRDEQPTSDLHVNFRLSRQGEAIGLSAPDGKVIDSVIFSAQEPDISQGRHPDGAPPPFPFMQIPTPGGPNIYLASDAPWVNASAIHFREDGALVLSWRAVEGVRYQLQYKNSLDEPQWTVLGETTATGEQATAFDATISGVPQRFYRILALE
jgi:hypothetical protein